MQIEVYLFFGSFIVVSVVELVAVIPLLVSIRRRLWVHTACGLVSIAIQAQLAALIATSLVGVSYFSFLFGLIPSHSFAGWLGTCSFGVACCARIAAAYCLWYGLAQVFQEFANAVEQRNGPDVGPATGTDGQLRADDQERTGDRTQETT
jgi:hypothetical protein